MTEVVDKLMIEGPPSAMVVEKDQEVQRHPLENLSYFCCKICSKRFLSGRALGGHMRAHGSPAMAEPAEKKRPISAKPMVEAQLEEEEEEEDGNPMHILRRNPKRSWRFADGEFEFPELDSRPVNSSWENSRVCDVCQKEFPSWKALFGHMKCHSDRLWNTHQVQSQKSESQSQEDDGSMDSESEGEIEQQPESEEYPGGNSRSFDMWMKGKRSKRPRYAIQSQSHHQEQFNSDNNEEEDMAICLVMLASGVNTATQKLQSHDGALKEPNVLFGSSDLKVPNNINHLEHPISIKKRPKTKVVDGNVDLLDGDEKKTRYECTTCNKTFHSYQALGGHRASHKKVKGCFSRIDMQEENESLEEDITDEEAITRSADSYLLIQKPSHSPKKQTKVSCDEESGETTIQPVAASSSVKKSRVHECSICHRVFASGQALGGHKRCHWGSAGNSDTISTVSSTKEFPVQQEQKPARLDLLDLNLPAPEDDDCDARQLNGLGGNVVDFHRPSEAEIRSKISPPFFQSWWTGSCSYPKQGMFSYNKYIGLSREDEADSKLGKKIGFGRVEDSQVPATAQAWLQL